MFYSPFENAANELHSLKSSIEEEKLFFGEELTCPKCKTRLSDLLETGYVGCSNCYKVFSKDLKNVIYNYHRADTHVGKKPDKIVSRAKMLKEIEELTREQAEASKKEDYILAQSIKEKVETLRRQYNERL